MCETRFGDFNFIASQLKNYYPKAKLKVFPMNRDYLIENDLLIDFCSRAMIDKTNLSKLNYTQDFQVSLDDDLRLKTDTLIIPDGIEKNNSQQAF